MYISGRQNKIIKRVPAPLLRYHHSQQGQANLETFIFTVKLGFHVYTFRLSL